MASVSCVLSEDQFLCSICLDVFTDPVTTSCGHSFCSTCINQHWDNCEHCHCPVCKEEFSSRPKIKISTFMAEMVSEFKNKPQSEDHKLKEVTKCETPDSGAVLCDVCPDPKLQALKSCLMCQTSFCHLHLQPHHTLPRLQKHQLIGPVKDLEDRICAQHDRLMEFYCKDHSQIICLMCSSTEHRDHDTVPLKQQCEEQHTDLQLKIQERREKLQEIQSTVQLSQKNADTEMEKGVRVFNELMQCVQHSLDQFKLSINKKHEEIKNKAEELIKSLESEICSLEQRRAEMEELLKSDDHFDLVQTFTSVKPASELWDWTEESLTAPSYQGRVATAVSELQNTRLRPKMKELFEDVLKQAKQHAVDTHALIGSEPGSVSEAEQHYTAAASQETKVKREKRVSAQTETKKKLQLWTSVNDNNSNNRMASVSCVLSEDQFLCSICLDVFTDPVTTSCGHSFCSTCINQHWDNCEHCHCPVCKEEFSSRPKIKINTCLSEMVSVFKNKPQSEDGKLEEVTKCETPDSGAVLCDVCPDPKLQALKSCLMCQTSFCHLHLQPHHTLPRLQKHQLIGPVKDWRTGSVLNTTDLLSISSGAVIATVQRSGTHLQVLMLGLVRTTVAGGYYPNMHVIGYMHVIMEFYCKDHSQIICLMCSSTEHRDHDTVPLKQQCEEQHTDLQLKIQERREKIQEIQSTVQLSQKNADTEMEKGVRVFNELMQCVQHSLDQFKLSINKKHEEINNKAEELIKSLESEICSLEQRRAEMEELLKSDDHFDFVQTFTSVKPASELWDWTEESLTAPSYQGRVATAVSELQNTRLRPKIEELFEDVHEQAKQHAVDVTLDPDTAHPKLHLSQDYKQVKIMNQPRNVPENPQRFSAKLYVLGNQKLSTGKFYFEVQVKEKSFWFLGVVKESANRKLSNDLTPENGYWKYILPLLSPCNNDSGNNSAPLVITPVSL
ncbi:hypothetical protein WMY93_009256 [Mugilogobius chulae]|uniref:Uncharacterized protein n=1 Tax=Mugilogobius chulae TaxID=88201 RepID=A0AAW0PB20_9GOBI